ncbi:hypothetical protein ACVBEG_27510, partial [Pseudomonas sp. GG8]
MNLIFTPRELAMALLCWLWVSVPGSRPAPPCRPDALMVRKVQPQPAGGGPGPGVDNNDWTVTYPASGELVAEVERQGQRRGAGRWPPAGPHQPTAFDLGTEDEKPKYLDDDAGVDARRGKLFLQPVIKLSKAMPVTLPGTSLAVAVLKRDAPVRFLPLKSAYRMLYTLAHNGQSSTRYRQKTDDVNAYLNQCPGSGIPADLGRKA